MRTPLKDHASKLQAMREKAHTRTGTSSCPQPPEISIFLHQEWAGVKSVYIYIYIYIHNRICVSPFPGPCQSFFARSCFGLPPRQKIEFTGDPST